MASAAIARRCLGTKEHKRHTPWGVRCENQGRTHQALPDRRGHCGVRATDGDGGVGAGQRHGERRNQRGRFLEQRGIGVDDTWWVRIIGLAGRWFGWLIFRGLGSTQSLHEPVAHSACRTSSAANRTEQNRTEQKTYGEVVNALAQRGQPAAGTGNPPGAPVANTEVVALSGVSRSLEEWWTSPRRPVGTCCDLRRCPGERPPAATPVRALRTGEVGGASWCCRAPEHAGLRAGVAPVCAHDLRNPWFGLGRLVWPEPSARSSAVRLSLNHDVRRLK